MNGTNPAGVLYANLTHFPRFRTWPFGMRWNLSWYSELADLTGLPSEIPIGVAKPKSLPASFNTRYNNEFSSLHEVTERGLNYTDTISFSRTYKELVYLENRCIGYCKTTDGMNETYVHNAHCKEDCMSHRKFAHEASKVYVKVAEKLAISCLRTHSLEEGDGNREAFDKCVESYNDALLDSSISDSILEGAIEEINSQIRIMHGGSN